MIKARSVRQRDDGGKNVRRLYNISKRITEFEIELFKDAFIDGAWQLDPIEFQKHFKFAEDIISSLESK